jgi:lactobin A/cerein 7B family class IIb bacteriocin
MQTQNTLPTSVTELSLNEIEAVNGGIAPAVIAGAKIIGFVGAIAVAAAIDYFND